MPHKLTVRALPPQLRAMSHTQFRRVPDASSPNFDPTDPRQVAESKLQRSRETKIAIEEVGCVLFCFPRPDRPRQMRLLQEKLFKCYYQAAPDHYTVCGALAREYKERLDWGATSLPPVGYEKSQCRLRRTPDGDYTMRDN